jgi:hypothetical protein
MWPPGEEAWQTTKGMHTLYQKQPDWIVHETNYAKIPGLGLLRMQIVEETECLCGWKWLFPAAVFNRKLFGRFGNRRRRQNAFQCVLEFDAV